MSLSSHFGYLISDNRASGGGILEQHTIGCNHCGAHVVMNPDRQRARAYCPKCDRYICDICEAHRHTPNYIHRTIDELTDLLKTGKWALSGTLSQPELTFNYEFFEST